MARRKYRATTADQHDQRALRFDPAIWPHRLAWVEFSSDYWAEHWRTYPHRLALTGANGYRTDSFIIDRVADLACARALAERGEILNPLSESIRIARKHGWTVQILQETR